MWSQTRSARRPAQIKKSLLSKLKFKKEVYRGRRQGIVTQKEHRNIVQASRGEARNIKTQMELNVAWDVQDSRQSFCTNFPSRENGGPLLSESGERVTQDMEKVEVLNAFFALFFTGKTSLLESEAPGGINTW